MTERVTFGPFELDTRTGRLSKYGIPLKISGQPVEVLRMLLERPGDLVTRDELRRRLWPGDTFVDFDHGLNAAVNKLRFALGDAAERPRYIETIPRRGYRFLGTVDAAPPRDPVPSAEPAPASADPQNHAAGRPRWLPAAALLIAVGLLSLLFWGLPHGSPSRSVPDRRVMLVVLPFENISGDREQDYFAEGLTEEMISLLGQLDPERLGVIARTSAAYYASGRWRVRQIAEQLGVDYVVEGSVRRSGGRVRVTAQLIRGDDETHTWARSYDRDVRDLLTVQHELARAIAGQIEIVLPPTAAAGARYTNAPVAEAYEAYLRGRHLLARRTREAVQSGYEYFREAVRLDPRFALGHAGLSTAYQQLASGGMPPAEAMPLALRAARRSLELDPDLAEGHAALAMILGSYEWNWGEAEREFRRALALNPNSVETRIAFASMLSHIGRVDEAIAEAKHALKVDPVSLAANAQLGVILYRARRHAEALAQVQAMLELDPNYPVTYLNLGLVHLAQGRHADALSAFERGRSLDRGSSDLAALLGHTFGLTGQPERARAILEELEAAAAREYVHPYTIALVQLGLGDRGSALDSLERSYRERSWMTVLVGMNPELDALRGDPRFQSLVRQMNVPR